jgi:cytochrome o ubiquinol oxidase subunit II
MAFSAPMKKLSLIFASLFLIVFCIGLVWYAKQVGVDVLEPAGYISTHERDLLVLASTLGLVCLIPIWLITYAVIHRYNVDNKKSTARYSAHWSIKPEASWIWGSFVVLIITILSVVLIKSTYAIDPYKPIVADTESLTIEVVALPWKWLFIHPDAGVASVNELVIPEERPIAFELTADAPMSSFWIPKLGGMIYVMEGMVTKHHLMASSTGEFSGVNTEINGKGYSGMKFTTKVVTADEYEAWVQEQQQSPEALTSSTYQQLAKQSTNNKVEHFSAVDPTLFDSIVAKFMHPTPSQDTPQTESTHDH